MLKPSYTAEVQLTSGTSDLTLVKADTQLAVQLAPFLQGNPGETSGITDQILDTAVEELRYDYDALLAAALII